ncbi:MAG TPA: hypothetical protein VGG46_11250 [Terriglobales bacterium]|jgi:hypothetical protein
MSKKTATVLRRTVTPYIGQTLIIFMFTIFVSWVAYTKQQWGLLWCAGLIWPLWASYILLFGLRYRIIWNDAGILMRASGGPERHIGFDEITEIRYEVAGATEFLAQSRPFRRIVILGRRSDPKTLIDISLCHFRTQDIKNLMNAIRERRPDMTIPTIPFNL